MERARYYALLTKKRTPGQESLYIRFPVASTASTCPTVTNYDQTLPLPFQACLCVLTDMNNDQHGRIVAFIWGIADDVLRDVYVRGKYRDVILPMTLLRRLDAVLENSKQDVLDMKNRLDKAKVVEQDGTLRTAVGHAFYNVSKFTLRDLKACANQQQLCADFEAYLDGFSPNVQDILDNFEFRNQIPRLSKADALGTLIEKLTSPDINLSPYPVKNKDGSIKHPGLDNHGMGTIFEELVRRFNEENNEEAGEHWTPRDAVKLMAKLIFLPVADKIKSSQSPVNPSWLQVSQLIAYSIARRLSLHVILIALGSAGRTPGCYTGIYYQFLVPRAQALPAQ